MRIFALDLATSTGFAIGMADGEPRFGTLRLPSTGDDVGAFLLAFDCWMRDTMALERPDRVVFEAPILRAGKTSIMTARKLGALASHTEFICADLQIPCAESNIGSIKLFFAGSGRAGKDDMIAVAHRYGWRVSDDNQADACGLWASAVHRYAPQHAGRFRMGNLGARA